MDVSGSKRKEEVKKPLLDGSNDNIASSEIVTTPKRDWRKYATETAVALGLVAVRKTPPAPSSSKEPAYVPPPAFPSKT
jgi:hypothetical protein